MTTSAPPLRSLIACLRGRWRARRGCRHDGWTLDGGCPGRGEL